MSTPNSHRALSDAEIQTLISRGCSAEADDWTRVQVLDGFDATRVSHVDFAGKVRCGALQSETHGRRAELRGVHLADCELGNNVRIVNVGLLANYDIAEGACVENVGSIRTNPDATFGNGVQVTVLNEAGGREVTMFNALSSQFAYLSCLYRYRPRLIDALERIAETAVQQTIVGRGQVGTSSRIANVPEIVDVHVGSRATVHGAVSLVNGSVLSTEECPTIIGVGVQASDFIVAEGAIVDGGALLSDTFVGQGCRVGRQFSAENCLMFANCEAFHGEACSVFFGPYSVTHHKSSLLIAGMFSYYNAGSGTNQSNHMYKVGPVHEGKLERGCKTGSFAYLMWPCRVGPYSVVLGKHARTFDTADLPFSHLEASPDGRCTLIPGFNLTTVGTVRDEAKWRTRDRRGATRRDRLTVDVFSPYTVGRMIRGSKLLQQFGQKTDRSVAAVSVNGVEIKRVFLRTGQKYYRRAIHMYLSEKVVARVEAKLTTGTTSMAAALASSPDAIAGDHWVDIGGQLMSNRRLEDLCTAIEQQQIQDATSLHEAFEKIESDYAEDEWAWVKQAYREVGGVDLDRSGSAELCEIADTLLKTRREFLELVLVDASKEFEEQSRIGFGMDGPREAVGSDFQAVRGNFDSNQFVRDIRQQIATLTQRVADFKQLMSKF